MNTYFKRQAEVQCICSVYAMGRKLPGALPRRKGRMDDLIGPSEQCKIIESTNGVAAAL